MCRRVRVRVRLSPEIRHFACVFEHCCCAGVLRGPCLAHKCPVTVSARRRSKSSVELRLLVTVDVYVARLNAAVGAVMVLSLVF